MIELEWWVVAIAVSVNVLSMVRLESARRRYKDSAAHYNKASTLIGESRLMLDTELAYQENFTRDLEAKWKHDKIEEWKLEQARQRQETHRRNHP